MTSLSLRPWLTTWFLCTCLVSLSHANPSTSSEKVTLSLYYETLCPYCADFIVNHLVKVFDNGLISIIHLRLIPWGNAFLIPDGSFLCQHGPNECFFNAIEACTITIYPDRNFAFIRCVERLSLANKLTEWVNCFAMSGLAAKQPIDCYTSGHGQKIERQYADETAQLNPPHKFVPWVVVNGQPLQEDYENFVSYVCKAYQGLQIPEACKSLRLENNTSAKEAPIYVHHSKSGEKNHVNQQVCYAEQHNNTSNYTSSALQIKALSSAHA